MRSRDKAIIEKLKKLNNVVDISSTSPYIEIKTFDEYSKNKISQGEMVISLALNRGNIEGINIFKPHFSSLFFISNNNLDIFKLDSSSFIISLNFKTVRKYLYDKIGLKIYSNFWDCYLANVFVSQSNNYSGSFNDREENLEVIYSIFKSQLSIFKSEPKLYKLFNEIEVPCSNVIFDIENTEILVNKEFVESVKSDNGTYKKLLGKTSIYPILSQNASVTGRIYTSGINLQSLGKDKIKALKPKEGNLFICADYSQEELRIIAALSRDKVLLSLMKKDTDLYSEIASIIFGISYSECISDKELRNKIKVSILSILYGASYYSIAKKLKISDEEAKEIINKIYLNFPNIKKLEAVIKKQIENNGYVVSLMGRRRKFKDKNQDLNKAFNSVIQMTGSDLLKYVLINLHNNKELKGLNCNIIFTIHDEIMFECPRENKEKASKIIKEIMENSFTKYIKIKMRCEVQDCDPVHTLRECTFKVHS